MQSISDLIQQLNEDLEYAERVLDLADREFEALSARDLKQLESLLGEKQPLLAQLAQHAAQRARLLQGLGLSVDREGLQRLAKASPDGEQLLAVSDCLGERFEECKRRNERNGRLIRANQQAVGGMLSALRGTHDAPSLYDSRGMASRSHGYRPLSEA